MTLMNVLQGPMAVLVALVDAETLLAPTRATVTQATDLLMDGLVLISMSAPAPAQTTVPTIASTLLARTPVVAVLASDWSMVELVKISMSVPPGLTSALRLAPTL